MKNVAVIGLGNPLMSDEGIGIEVVARLREVDLPDAVEVLDLGTSGMRVLHEIEGRKKVVFVDCALMGTVPGTLRRFVPEDVVSNKAQPGLSLHEGDLFNTLALARQIGTCPDDIVIFGIEPKLVDFGEGLSRELQDNLDTYVARVRAEVDA